MDEVTLIIDNIEVSVPKGATVLEAAGKVGIKIPTLCYLEELHQEGICRMCVVDIGRPNLIASCNLVAQNGMSVKTNSKKIRDSRKSTLELILSAHVKDCLSCARSTDCELQELATIYNVNAENYPEEVNNREVDDSSTSIVRDSGKCILCRRCISVCQGVQSVFTLGSQGRGSSSLIGPAFENMSKTVCVNCGQCIAVCPVNAIYEKNEIDFVLEALDDPDKYVVVQTAPAIRAALGETQGLPVGTCVTKQMTTALKRIGFDAVFDTNFSADLTIMEEGTELLTRLKKVLVDGDKETKLPMFTSCSPGWIKFLEHFYPEFTENLSTCKSPQQMMGAVAKTYYAQKKGIDPSKIVMVSIMPCTAKKFENRREEMSQSGHRDVDYVLTTRELGKLIKMFSLDFAQLPDGEFDNPLGISSGAADIFANSGGVMEAALRTVYELVTGTELPGDKLHVKDLMDIEGVREFSLTIDKTVEAYNWLQGVELKIAATSGLGNARKILDKIKSGEANYHFVEIMTCPGGCIGGGGQPRLTDKSIRQKRFDVIKTEDEGKKYRKSHENPSISLIYKDFLETPNSHKAHELLHTTYIKRGI